jgi:hypothetical protein
LLVIAPVIAQMEIAVWPAHGTRVAHVITGTVDRHVDTLRGLGGLLR